MEAYLNKVYWGHGVVGIAHASAAYFRKKPSQLQLGEVCLLVGLTNPKLICFSLNMTRSV